MPTYLAVCQGSSQKCSSDLWGKAPYIDVRSLGIGLGNPVRPGSWSNYPPGCPVPVVGGDRTCHWKPDTLFVYTDALDAGLSASIPDNNQHWRNSFVELRWENGEWGTLFRSSIRKVSDGSLKSIHLTPEETIIYDELTRDDGATTSWTLLEEFSLIHVGLSSVSQQAAKEINEDNVPLVEETVRMKKALLAGLDTREKATEPSFLRKHKEPMVEVPAEGAEAHSAPITAAAHVSVATGAFQPLWGFRRGDTVVGSTKHALDLSYHSVTPKDFTDVVATPGLERIKLMGAQSLASSNAYFQGAVRQAESWKRASEKADNALRKQQKKYTTLERKLKRKEKELGESNAELVVLRAEKDKAIGNYLDSEDFT
ncbi:hypothetical protein AgCh_036117 [Apium graveolens]